MSLRTKGYAITVGGSSEVLTLREEGKFGLAVVRLERGKDSQCAQLARSRAVIAHRVSGWMEELACSVANR